MNRVIWIHLIPTESRIMFLYCHTRAPLDHLLFRLTEFEAVFKNTCLDNLATVSYSSSPEGEKANNLRMLIAT